MRLWKYVCVTPGRRKYMVVRVGVWKYMVKPNERGERGVGGACTNHQHLFAHFRTYPLLTAPPQVDVRGI